MLNSSLRQFREHREYLYYMLHDRKKAAWRVENVTAQDLELVKGYYEKGISDASSRALIWYLRNKLYYQQGAGPTRHPPRQLREDRDRDRA